MTSPPPIPLGDPLTSVDRMLALLEENFPAVDQLPPEEVRQIIRSRAVPVTNLDDVATTRDVTLTDGPVLRVYHPHGQAADAPAILYFHGGGWMFCGIDSHDGFCRRVARETGAVVVSVDYRLAPEHRFPAALNDGFGALEWLVGSDLGIDPARIAVMGDSAGGNLAAALCLMARDRGGPAIAGQVLLYPVLAPDFETEGYRRFGTGHYNTTAAMRHYWRNYLGGDERPDPPDLAAPLWAASHAGLPPAIIVVPGRDPTCSEAESYAAALRGAGVALRLRSYPDMFHGFMTLLAFDPAEGARRLLWSDMAKLLAKKGQSR